MSYLVKLAAIIYHSYDDRGIDIPHFRTIITIALSLFFHILQIGLLFNLPSQYIMPWNSKLNRPMQWFSGAIYFGVLTILILLIFRKSKLEKIEVSQTQMDKCKAILPIYLTFNLIFVIILLVLKGVEQGKIHF